MASNPCRYCDERSATCHATCPRYKDFEKKNAEERDARARANDIKDAISGYDAERFRKRQREKRYKNGF